MGKADEKRFFDESYATKVRRPLYKYYALTRASLERYEQELFRDCDGRDVLEYGCGVGSYSLPLARRGARVTGIDISAEAIRISAAAAEKEGLDQARFIEMDAEAMSFADDSFDMIVGTAILHHLDLPVALAELGRVLRPGGRAVFLEPLGHNPALNAFRRLTPQYRTADEHPLLRGDLKLLRNHFGVVDCYYYHLFSFLSLAFLRTRFFFPVMRALDRFDQGVFRLAPPLRSWSWYAAIVLRDPVPAD